MSLVSSRSSAPDSEASCLPASPQADPAARVRALARRIMMSCNATPADPLPGLSAQFALCDEIFGDLLLTNPEMHGLAERDGLRLALRLDRHGLRTLLAEHSLADNDRSKI